MSLLIPSYKAGFARCAAESENPGLWKGLKGLWAPYLGPTGLTLFDWSGYGKNGTLTNMNPATDWVATDQGWALNFPVGTPYLNCNAGILPTSTFWTIGVWAKWTLTTGLYLFCDNGGVTNLLLQRNATHNLQLYVDGSNTAYGTALAIDEWHLFVLVLDGANARLYVDGVLYHSLAGLTWAGMSGNLLFGNRAAGDREWIGYISNSFVANRTWSISEIQQLYARPHAMLTLRSRVYATAVAPAANAPTGHLYGPLVGPLGGAV